MLRATDISRFFQTHVGGYGEGDEFSGTRVPNLRSIARRYADQTSILEAEILLQNPLHEARFTALVILINKFKTQREEVFGAYLRNTKYINNWDLVDVSAPHIPGPFVFDNKDFDTIWKLAKSNDLWENRIAIVSSWHFIKKNSFDLTLKLCEHFLAHEHHLIHKASGWMLRELGKRDQEMLLSFIKKNSETMPKIMKRYALERTKTRCDNRGMQKEAIFQ